MRAQLKHRRALILGGTGAVGNQVLRALAAREIKATFTYQQSEAMAKQLEDLGHQGLRVDLREPEALRAALASLPSEPPITLLIHCAARLQSGTIEEVSTEDFAALWSINVASAYAAARFVAPMMQHQGGEILFTGALDRSQSLPAPVAFSATQGALGAMTMSLAKELGPKIRVNMLTFGPLAEGLSLQMAPRLLQDFKSFSALRRMGTPEEAAAALLWFAFENTYVSGEVIPVNGGI